MKEENILNDNIKFYNELEKAIDHHILRQDMFLPEKLVKSMLFDIVKRRLEDFYISK